MAGFGGFKGGGKGFGGGPGSRGGPGARGGKYYKTPDGKVHYGQPPKKKAQVGDIVHERRNRETGTVIRVEKTGPGHWLDQDKGWATICLDHSHSTTHQTRATAMGFASEVTTWCEECQKNHPKKGHR